MTHTASADQADLLAAVLREFSIDGTLKQVQLLKRGHINETFIAGFEHGGKEEKYILQRINREVFLDIPGLMENASRVLQHIRARLVAGDRCVTIVPTLHGTSYYVDEAGEYWRVLSFIEGAESSDICSSLEEASEAAKLCGRFQSYIMDLNPAEFRETIKRFHHTPSRYQLLRQAVTDNAAGRANDVQPEIEFVYACEEWAGQVARDLESGALPWRVTHNDLKFNNVLFTSAERRAICLIDIDTYMPGSPVYDFGDLVRNTSVPAAEDERDLSKVAVDMRFFEALARGYLGALLVDLTEAELQHCRIGGPLMTLTIGIRFLTDHLNGDKYFRVHRPNHNLDRARCQFQIVRSMQRHASDISEIFENLSQQ